MGIDISQVPFGPIAAVFILVFLVQTIYEASEMEGRYVPIVAIVVGISMMVFATYVPETLLTGVATGLGVAAVGSTTVRYVKKEHHEKRPVSLQGHDTQTTGSSGSEPQTTTVHDHAGQTGLWTGGSTEPLPHYHERLHRGN